AWGRPDSVSTSPALRTFSSWWKHARIWPMQAGFRCKASTSPTARSTSAIPTGRITPSASTASARRRLIRQLNQTMKTNIKNTLLVPALFAALGLMSPHRATAQTFSTLHSFTATHTNSSDVYTNSDGVGSWAGLISNPSGNILYGTTYYGGSSGYGTVFAVHTDGSGFTTLHSFTAISGPNNTNRDGAYPTTGLLLSGNTLYGTAPNGGSSGNGTVFAVGTDGSGFTNLHSFTATPTSPNNTNSDGAQPEATLILTGNILYGTASVGGNSGYGT